MRWFSYWICVEFCMRIFCTSQANMANGCNLLQSLCHVRSIWIYVPGIWFSVTHDSTRDGLGQIMGNHVTEQHWWQIYVSCKENQWVNLLCAINRSKLLQLAINSMIMMYLNQCCAANCNMNTKQQIMDLKHFIAQTSLDCDCTVRKQQYISKDCIFRDILLDTRARLDRLSSSTKHSRAENPQQIAIITAINTTNVTSKSLLVPHIDIHQQH